MRLELSTDSGNFSDSALSDLQRRFSSLPEPPADPRERSGRRRRIGQGRRPKLLVILDGRKVRALRVRRGFPTLTSLAAAARISEPHLSHAADYGELSQEAAMRLALALQCPLEAITFGVGYRTNFST